MDRIPAVFDALMAAGRQHGIRLFGTYAMNSLRMEKAYRGWGSELTNEIGLVAAGMERFVAFDKEFVGRAATLREKQRGPKIRLVYLSVDAVDNDSYGNEPIYHASAGDRPVGLTTGGAFGHKVGQSLAFAYVETALARPGERFEVLMMANRVAARVLREPAWDPQNHRPRADGRA
jgi:dimethylglycine dehydrogenase